MLVTQLGDSLYLLSIKELASVVDFVKIHPAVTLMGGEGDALTSAVRMSDEMSITSHGFFTNGDTLDLEKYWQKIHGK